MATRSSLFRPSVIVSAIFLLLSSYDLQGSKPEYNTDYVDGTKIGLQKALASSFLRYPLVALRTIKQASSWKNNQPTSTFHYLKQSYERGGVFQLYRGSIFYASEMVLRESYKYPLIVTCFPYLIEKFIPAKYQSPLMNELYAGWFLSILDASLGCPLNNARNLMITSKRNLPVHVLFNRLKGTPFQKAYRGYMVKTIRGLTHYTTLFPLDYLIRTQAQHITGHKELNIYEQMTTAGLTGILTTIAVTPFEVMLVLLQKENAISDQGLWKNMGTIYRSGSIRATYAGLSLDMMQRTIGSILTVWFMNYANNKVVQQE